MSKIRLMETIIFYLISAYMLNSVVNAEELVKRTQVMMGTYVSVSLEKDSLLLSSKVFKRLKQVELGLSSYDKKADIYKLNHDFEVLISSDTYEALVLSKQYYKDTDGYFDISIGSITKGLFHFGEKERIPSENELIDARVDFHGLHFNKGKAWIDKGIKIDLGGMGKGFGVDKAVELLKDKGVKKGVIALSGDIFCLDACEMAIQDPFSSNALAHFTMAQPNTSISTSGNYQRYVKSKKYNHLINPKTKKSQKTFASISLISIKHNNADLDAYATAASVMPRHRAFVFLNKMKDIGYLVVDESKRVTKNKTFDTLVKDFVFMKPQDLHERVYIKAVPLRFQNSKRL